MILKLVSERSAIAYVPHLASEVEHELVGCLPFLLCSYTDTGKRMLSWEFFYRHYVLSSVQQTAPK